MDQYERKSKIIETMTAMEIQPLSLEKEVDLNYYTKIPISRITALGIGMEPILASIQQITGKGQGLSGYYKVTIPKGTKLAQFKHESAYLGTALNGAGIDSQARLNPISLNPTIFLVAATLANIDQKLESIQEAQLEMLDFLKQKEKSALKGDLIFLMDVYNNYKHNWNSEKYKNANHIKVLDIRQSAGKMIDFYREQIKKHVGKRTLFHSDKDVNNQLREVMSEFEEYQLASYLYGFSYFLEVLLQENFDKNYLQAITTRLEEYAFQYRVLYTEVYSLIERYQKTSVQSYIFSRLSAVNKAAGETIGKIPVISKGQIDENLINSGNKIGKYGDGRAESTMAQLVEHQSSSVRPFIENIIIINELYNKSLSLIFNDESIYLKASE